MAIITANRYTDVRAGGSAPAKAPQLFLPTVSAGRTMLRDWYWRELKEGGWLWNYLHREKARTPGAVRRVARIMHGFQQNPKSDFRRLATVPAKLYHRWKDEDDHFWEDDENLRSLKRDNPDLPVYLQPRQLPTSRFRKVYPAQTMTA